MDASARPIEPRFSQPSWVRRLSFFWRRPERLNLANLTQELARLFGERTALCVEPTPLRCPDGRLARAFSYADLDRVVAQFAGGLLRLGVRRGDRVALMTMNRAEMLLVALAAARLGAIPVPLSFMLRPDEVDAIARRAAVRALVTDNAVMRGVIRDRRSVPTVELWLSIDEPSPGVVSILDAAADAEAVDVPEHVGGRDPAMIFFTSGTTGVPKGAILSHDAAMVGIRRQGAVLALRPRMAPRRALAVMPVAHAGGYAALLIYFAMGWPVLFCGQFDPPAVLDLMESWRVTAFSGTPAMYRMLLGAGAAQRDLTSIRLWGGGGDAFPDDLVRAVRKLGKRRAALGVKREPSFVRGYGMAEANSYVALSPPFPVGDRCLGWVIPPMRYRVVDEGGGDVARGTPGELLLAGPTIADGYWNDTEATTACFEGGWFHTGDIVREGRGKLLYFVDRSRDIIKCGGFKIAAAEVDNVLEGHPDVMHSATVGLPHETLGEEVVTAVVLRPEVATPVSELMAWTRARLASQKCPRRLLIVEELPLTFSLKPKRREVRALLTSSNLDDARVPPRVAPAPIG